MGYTLLINSGSLTKSVSFLVLINPNQNQKKMEKNKKTTTTQVNAPWKIWATFTAIIKIKQQSKNAVFTEMLKRYNDENKEVLN